MCFCHFVPPERALTLFSRSSAHSIFHSFAIVFRTFHLIQFTLSFPLFLVCATAVPHLWHKMVQRSVGFFLHTSRDFKSVGRKLVVLIHFLCSVSNFIYISHRTLHFCSRLCMSMCNYVFYDGKASFGMAGGLVLWYLFHRFSRVAQC